MKIGNILETMTRTHKETAHSVFLAITEIDEGLEKCQTLAQKNALMKRVCEKNDISEQHIRTVAKYDFNIKNNKR